MKAIQLEFDFDVKDQSLNTPKKQTYIICKGCKTDMKYDEISQRDRRYCVHCIGS